MSGYVFRSLALRLSRSIVNQRVSPYPVRVNVLVGWTKCSVGRKLIADVDNKLAWQTDSYRTSHVGKGRVLSYDATYVRRHTQLVW